MPVALHAPDPEQRLHREVLQQRDRPDVRKILAAHHPSRSGIRPAELGHAAGVRDALEHALAVLVAGPRITDFQRTSQAAGFRIRFVDDDRRSIGPRAPIARRAVQRHVTMQRLLDEQQMTPHARQRRPRRERRPKFPKRRRAPEAFVSIQAERKIPRRAAHQQREDSLQPVDVLRPPADLDLEVTQPVNADARVERLGQSVLDPFTAREIARLERIGQAHRVTHRHPRERRRRQPFGRRAPGQLAVKLRQIHPERIRPHEAMQRRGVRAGKRIEQGPLHQRRPEMHQQRGKIRGAPPRALRRMEFAPERKQRRRPHLDRRGHRLPNHAQHLLDFLPQIARGILGEPLGREMIRRHAVVRATLDLAGGAQKDVRHLGHRGDAVAERQPRPQLETRQSCIQNPDHDSVGTLEALIDLSDRWKPNLAPRWRPATSRRFCRRRSPRPRPPSTANRPPCGKPPSARQTP